MKSYRHTKQYYIDKYSEYESDDLSAHSCS